MKAYSLDFREKIIKVYEQKNTSIRKVANQFNVSKAFVQKLIKQKSTIGHLQPSKQGGTRKSIFFQCHRELALMVEKDPDATLSEYCEYWGETYNQWVSTSTMCRALQREQLTRKKRLGVAPKQQQRESKNLDVSIGNKSKE
jgi:transposase